MLLKWHEMKWLNLATMVKSVLFFQPPDMFKGEINQQFFSIYLVKILQIVPAKTAIY